jgi:hypothetical protein
VLGLREHLVGAGQIAKLALDAPEAHGDVGDGRAEDRYERGDEDDGGPAHEM